MMTGRNELIARSRNRTTTFLPVDDNENSGSNVESELYESPALFRFSLYRFVSIRIEWIAKILKMDSEATRMPSNPVSHFTLFFESKSRARIATPIIDAIGTIVNHRDGVSACGVSKMNCRLIVP